MMPQHRGYGSGRDGPDGSDDETPGHTPGQSDVTWEFVVGLSIVVVVLGGAVLAKVFLL